MIYCQVTVPFTHLSNFYTLMNVWKGHVETGLDAVNNDASVDWVLRTEYGLENALKSLQEHHGFTVKFFTTQEELTETVGELDWMPGLARTM
jgi:hypothetical protein